MEVVKNHEQEKQKETKGYTFMEKEKIESLKRKALVVKDLSVASAMEQLRNPKTITYAAAACLYHGLKYNGSFKRGIRAGLATMGAFVGAKVVTDLLQHGDEIKKP